MTTSYYLNWRRSSKKMFQVQNRLFIFTPKMRWTGQWNQNPASCVFLYPQGAHFPQISTLKLKNWRRSIEKCVLTRITSQKWKVIGSLAQCLLMTECFVYCLYSINMVSVIPKCAVSRIKCFYTVDIWLTSFWSYPSRLLVA